LLESIIQPIFDNPLLNQKHDSAVLQIDPSKIAFTTDSYVINPLFFPGGNIGTLAVCGTLNDLAMSGARPSYISCSLIIEEGFAIALLTRILTAMQRSAEQAGIFIVTGDTKVVDNGKGDGIYINTAGIGSVDRAVNSHPDCIQEGDNILINSDLGRHGISIMLQREGLVFDNAIRSDCADLSGLVQALIAAEISIHCMRDLTRGGLSSALIELADTANCLIEIDENTLPIRDDVQSACEILGLDPMFIANEGCFVLFIPEQDTAKAIQIMQQHKLGKQACQIGRVIKKSPDLQPRVSLQTTMGVSRILDLFSGEQLPRIC